MNNVQYILAGVANVIAVQLVGGVLLGLVFARVPVSSFAALFTHEPALTLVCLGEALIGGAIVTYRHRTWVSGVWFILPMIFWLVIY